jgi:hypothetical protein
VLLTPVANLPQVSLTSVANLPQVSLTPVANLPPVSTTPAELVAKFATGVVDKLILVVHFDLQIFPQIFKKI